MVGLNPGWKLLLLLGVMEVLVVVAAWSLASFMGVLVVLNGAAPKCRQQEEVLYGCYSCSVQYGHETCGTKSAASRV
jgi:hypothetical protein